MKFWKNWAYFILMGAVGFLYLNYVDHWQVYAGTVEQAKALYLEVTGRGDERENGSGSPDGTGGPGDGTGSGEVGNPEGIGSPDGTSEPGDGTGNGESENPEGSGNPDGTGEPGDGTGEVGNPEGIGSPDGTGEPGDGTGSGEVGNPEGSGNPDGAGRPEELGPPEYVTVEDDYFSDAVFIGDSRTVGMYEYGELEEISTFYASTGLTVYKLFDSAIVNVPGQKQKITVEEALQNNSFSKIYLMVGINEMGTGTVETFIEKYKEVVAHLQELQPEAILYIQGIMKVTTKRSEQGDYINNEGIIARNQELEKLADNRQVFYLDVNPVICDETGGLVEDYTFDGVHLKAKYIQIWKDYLKQHAIQK